MANIEELTQDDIDKLEKALERAKKDAQKFREERDEYKVAAEAGEVNEKFKQAALTAEAKLRLGAAGIKDPERVLKYLSFDGVEWGEDGNLAGLDEKIETVKSDFPELWGAKRRVESIDAAANNPVKIEKSTTEAAVDKALGRK